MTKDKKDYFMIGSLAKGMRVIELLAEKGPLKVTEVASHLGFNRSASHRFLATFQALGYLSQDDNDLRYKLDFKFIELCTKVIDKIEIRQIARPFLQELSALHNETVNLGLLNMGSVLHIDKIESDEMLRVDVGLGGYAPAYCSALGKCLIARFSKTKLENYINTTEFVQFTPNTITTKEMFEKEIFQINRQGYAIDNEELALGLRCIAAPIMNAAGSASYAMSVSGPTSRMTFDRLDKIRKDLIEICQKISKEIGTKIG